MRNAKIIRSAANIIKQKEIKRIYTTRVSKVSLIIIVLFHSSRRNARAAHAPTSLNLGLRRTLGFYLLLFAYYYYYYYLLIIIFIVVVCLRRIPRVYRRSRRPLIGPVLQRASKIYRRQCRRSLDRRTRRDTTIKRLHTVLLSVRKYRIGELQGDGKL